jgi:HSP20 family molecular chaperone IbpA
MVDEFQRTCDQLFEDLIDRWQERKSASRGSALLIDLGDRFEVRVTLEGADPREFEIEATERRLRITTPGPLGPIDNILELPHPVDPEATTARLDGGVLLIALPKRRGRRIVVE